MGTPSKPATTTGDFARSLLGWTLLFGGLLVYGLVTAAGDAVDLARARRMRQQLEAECAAVATEIHAWQEIAEAFETQPTFREEWRRRELGGLVPTPRGVPVAAALRVDPRRPQAVTIEPVALPSWFDAAAGLAAPSRLRTSLLTGGLLAMLAGLVLAECSPAALAATATRVHAGLHRRYRLDSPHRLRGWWAGRHRGGRATRRQSGSPPDRSRDEEPPR